MNWENIFVFAVVTAVCAAWIGLFMLITGINPFG